MFENDFIISDETGLFDEIEVDSLDEIKDNENYIPMENSIQLYIHQINAIPLLSFAQEQELGKEIIRGNEQAKNAYLRPFHRSCGGPGHSVRISCGKRIGCYFALRARLCGWHNALCNK